MKISPKAHFLLLSLPLSLIHSSLGPHRLGAGSELGLHLSRRGAPSRGRGPHGAHRARAAGDALVPERRQFFSDKELVARKSLGGFRFPGREGGLGCLGGGLEARPGGGRELFPGGGDGGRALGERAGVAGGNGRELLLEEQRVCRGASRDALLFDWGS